MRRKVMLVTEPKAFRQLQEHGKLATFREDSERGPRWIATERPIQEKKFDARVYGIQPANPFENREIFESIRHISGFETTEEWIKAIKRQHHNPGEGYIKLVERE